MHLCKGKYRDEELVAENANGNAPRWNVVRGLAQLGHGIGQWDQYFHGEIADFIYFDRSISKKELRYLVQHGRGGGKEPPSTSLEQSRRCEWGKGFGSA